MLEIRLGTLTLRIAGHGDLGDLERQYEPHSVSGAIDPDGVVEVRIDRTLAHLPSADSLSPLRAWSVTGSSLKITAEMWEATVALTPGGVTHVVMRAWGAWEFDLLMGCLLQVMGPVYGLGLVVHGSAVVRDGRGYVFFCRQPWSILACPFRSVACLYGGLGGIAAKNVLSHEALLSRGHGIS